jgi:electron transport complex protein RnfE
MCPTLAVTTSVENGIGMGLAATFVLVCSNVVISLMRNLIPSKVRIPCYIVIIATFVTVVDLLMNGFAHDLHKSLGLFIPLIVVNCIILGRAEGFASKHGVLRSCGDGLGMGLGFTLALIVVAAVREVLGAGTITIWGGLKAAIPGYEPMVLMILAPGGFVALGVLLGLMNRIQTVAAEKKGKRFTPPAHLDCRHCVLCRFGGE